MKDMFIMEKIIRVMKMRQYVYGKEMEKALQKLQKRIGMDILVQGKFNNEIWK